MEQGVLRESKDSLTFYSLMVIGILLVHRTCFDEASLTVVGVDPLLAYCVKCKH